MIAEIDIGDIITVAFWVIVILGSVFGSVIERTARKKRQEEALRRSREARGAEPEEDDSDREVPEAKLPYEEMAEEFFGDYMDRRRREHAERQARLEEEDEDDIVITEVLEERPARRRRPEVVVLEPARRPKARPRAPLMAAPDEEHGAAAEFPLSARVFKGREPSPVVQAVVYTEIFGPPRARAPYRRR